MATTTCQIDASAKLKQCLCMLSNIPYCSMLPFNTPPIHDPKSVSSLFPGPLEFFLNIAQIIVDLFLSVPC